MNRLFRAFIQILFFLFSILFFIAGFVTIFNYYFEFSIDKISVEVVTTYIFGIGFILIGVAFLLLFWGLCHLKKWFINLYWVNFILFIIMLFLITSPFSSGKIIEDIVFLIFVIGFPVSLGIYLTKHRSIFF
jgi:hypothetical protein